jgi:hypothetical protein
MRASIIREVAVEASAEFVYHPRIPVADDYVAAAGRAAYNFAYLEWGIVWLCEKLERDYIHTVESKTAGVIAADFARSVAKPSDLPLEIVERLSALADHFSAAVVARNQIMHGTPMTAANGEQRLRYTGKHPTIEWTANGLLQAAKSFEDVAIEANDLFHNHLAK